MRNFKSSFLAVALATAAATVAAIPVNGSGASIKVTFDDPIFTGTGWDIVNVTYALPAGGSHTANVAAGRFQGKAIDVGNLDKNIFVDSVDQLFMYCYDIYQGISPGQKVDYTVDFNSVTVRTLAFLGAVNSVMSFGQTYDPYAWLHPVNGNQGAAIQLGIWESLYDTTGWNLSDGNFKVNRDLNLALNGANPMLGTATYFKNFADEISNSAPLDAKYTMTFKSATFQDMIAGDPPLNVPEPGSLALIGLALAGLAGSRQLRRKA